MRKTPMEAQKILLGVTGSIAAYKAADLASKLHQAGAHVDVILTAGATRFVTPLTFQSITGGQAYTDTDLWGREGHILHVGLARGADLIVIAPVTANTLAKLAHGQADNLLTVTALAVECPIILAPAMDGGMYSHPATQSNLDILQQRGVRILGPVEGHLASGQTGPGRLMEPQELLGHIRLVLSGDGPLKGRHVIVTAGGTQEPIDPVRTITNRSSGRQGYALAQAALDLGADVLLITTPTSLPTPTGARRVAVATAEEMLTVVLAESSQADALLMAAAVADFRPAEPATGKIKKEASISQIALEPTPDILLAVADLKSQQGKPRCVVGFAAETDNLLDNARQKLVSKKLDMIVANDISAPDSGFAVTTNRVTLVYPNGHVEALPLLGKDEVAAKILQHVVAFLGGASEPEMGPASQQAPHR